MAVRRQALKTARPKRGAIPDRGDASSKLGKLVRRPELLGPALALLAGFNLLALFWPGGALGAPWRHALHLVFGWGAYLTPIGLALAAAAVIANHLRDAGPISRRVVVGWIITFVAFECALDALFGGWQPAWGELAGGGYLGWLIVEGLYIAIGGTGAFVVIALIAILGLFLASGLTPAAGCLEQNQLSLKLAGCSRRTNCSTPSTAPGPGREQ